jgi:hypothetical protein
MFSVLIVSLVLVDGLESESADEAEDEDPTPGGHRLLDARDGVMRVGFHQDAESMHPQVSEDFIKPSISIDYVYLFMSNVATRTCFSLPILFIINVCTLPGTDLYLEYIRMYNYA